MEGKNVSSVLFAVCGIIGFILAQVILRITGLGGYVVSTAIVCVTVLVVCIIGSLIYTAINKGD